MDALRVAGVLGAVGVLAGAFGAHGLKNVEGITDARIDMVKTGATYQLVHAVAIGALGRHSPRAALAWTAGTVLFSGSLYAYGLTGHKKFGAVAPIGGSLFVVGWIILALA